MDKLVREVDRTIRVYEEIVGHGAMRTRNMIDEYGHVEALSRLVVSADLQQGFKVLAEKDRLEDSFEALVVRFSGRFRDDVVEAARWRLGNPDELLKRVR